VRRGSRTRRGRARILVFSGPSGVGKTTLLEKLLPALVARGLKVGALKHSGHPHPFDRPGKDSARLRAAGAVAVVVQGPAELAYFGPPVIGIRALARLLPNVDLVVAESFKTEPLPRVEVHRAEIDRRFLCARDPHVVAFVGESEPPRPLPWFTPGEVDELAEFVTRFALGGRQPRKRALASGPARVHRVSLERNEPREQGMARTTKTSGRTRTARGRSTSSRGGATVREAGRKGGRRTLERRGPEFYSRIGRKGGKSSGGVRRTTASRRKTGKK
jgi:molybdopterin-guanine dinucleotide biosynthesis protein B